MKQQRFLEKELSWLSFNHRVLQEAQDSRVPLLERLRFLGIYSSNMDEFYRVRVANIRRNVLLSNNKKDKHTALTLFDDIQHKVIALQTEFDATYSELLLRLSENDIQLINETQLCEAHSKWLNQYYKEKLRRHIFPLILTDEIKLADHINDDETYLMVSMRSADDYQYALVAVPSSNVPRFVQLPDKKDSNIKQVILLDNIIRHCLTQIFSGFFEFNIIHAYSMKFTRDAEFELTNEISQSLFERMSSGLRQRLNAEPVRLVYDKKMPKEMLIILKQHLGIVSDKGLIAGGRYHSFKDFIEFPNVGDKSLEFEKLASFEQSHFSTFDNAFNAIKRRDILLYYPYHKFSHFTELLRQSAYDPKVNKIQICLYRVAKKSRVISALIEAVKNGKEVEVNIELHARFDEQANMVWAEKLTNAGAAVSYGIPNLKVHAKICLVTRQEQDGLQAYAHIGSGNFNEKNAKIYTDFSLFSCDKKITNEVAQVFEFLKRPYIKFQFNHLIVSPINSRSCLNMLINSEIIAAQQGKKSGIILKVNNLVDQHLIEQLYKASNAGVVIKLIVRGICSLITGLAGMSENIMAISIVDRYLEHPRVAVFENAGQAKVYLSSADWMTRNIDNRVEVGCPIYCPHVKKTILDILAIQLSDNTKARVLDTAQSNQYKTPRKNILVRSQVAIYHYLKQQQLAYLPLSMTAQTHLSVGQIEVALDTSFNTSPDTALVNSLQADLHNYAQLEPHENELEALL
ncbi:MAG: polyphosphate kinase 1 [Oceanospirillaceae bacterium]